MTDLTGPPVDISVESGAMTAIDASPSATFTPHQILVLATVCLAGLMLPLSFTGPAVATPAIAQALGGSPAALAWVVNAFILSFGSCVMAAGSLADQVGRKRVFTIGVALFVILSVLIGFAPNIILLDIGRAALGVAAALAMSGGAAALAQEFDGSARTKAFSLLGTTFGVGLAFGPIWSGFLIETFGWRSIFLSGGLIGAIVLAVGAPRLRETRDPGATGIDWPGTLSFTTMLALLTFGIVEAPELGWDSLPVRSLLAGTVVMLAVFIAVERRRLRPMLDLTLFRYPRFVGVQFLPIATAFSYVGLLIYLPIRFIGIEGMNEVRAGLLLIPLSAPMAIVPFIAALLTRWIAASTLSGIGLVIAAGGILWLSAVPFGSSAAALVWPLLVIGIGTGLPWGLMDDLSVSVVPKERAGMATGIFTTMRVAGEAITIALIGAVLASLTEGGLAGSLSSDQAQPIATLVGGGNLEAAAASLPGLDRAILVQAYEGAFRGVLHLLAAVTVAAAVISVVALRRPHHR